MNLFITYLFAREIILYLSINQPINQSNGIVCVCGCKEKEEIRCDSYWEQLGQSKEEGSNQ